MLKRLVSSHPERPYRAPIRASIRAHVVPLFVLLGHTVVPLLVRP